MMLGSEAMTGTAIGWALAASVGLIVLNGVYVAYEFAILASRQASFEGSGRANAAARTSLADVSMQLAGAQLGITIASLALGRISEPALEVLVRQLIGTSVSPDAARVIGVTISLAVFTVLHLVFGEMVPKNIALAAPEATLRWLVIPYRLYLLLFRPVVTLLNGLANVASRAVGIQPRDELRSVHTASELAALVAHSTEGGAIEAADAEFLQGVLEFAERPVVDIAAAVAEYPAVRVGSTIAEVEAAVVRSGKGRVLILDRQTGSVPVGYLLARDLLDSEPDQRTEPIPGALVRVVAVVPPERPLVDVLFQLRRSRRYVAVVQGSEGPVGIVSQSEIVQALVEPDRVASSLQAETPGAISRRPHDPGTADG